MNDSFWNKLNEEAIQSTQLLDTILNSMASGVFLVNMQGIITYWNRAAERITGYNREEVLGKPCGELPGETCSDGGCDSGILGCGLFNSESEIERECRIIGKSGKPIYLIKSARVVKDRDNRPFMGIVNIVDVTGIKKADREIRYLRSCLETENVFENIIGDTPAMHKIFGDIRLAAESNASVLVMGESGTGKELVAQAIHSFSKRNKKPFITVNCCSLPETLLESELFGHQKGSFTGAIRNQVGRFEAADGGTLFIDEVGELPLTIQVKLLRFMQARTIERIGETKTRKLDVRVISATNHDLAQLVASSKFREDLYYRLNVFPITMPSLRERKMDIPLLVDHFIETISEKTGKKITGVAQNTSDALIHYNWPGNVRELENAIEHAFVRVQSNFIEQFDLPDNILKATRVFTTSSRGSKYSNLTRETILKTLAEYNWHRQETADALGISRITLWKKMKTLRIK